MVLKILLLVFFFAVMVAVGIYCRRTATNVQGFVLAGRNVGSWLTAFAFGTSYFSAVIFVGYAGQFGWRYGLAATWIGIGNALIGSLLAWRILGRRTRLMTQYLHSATMPDFFGRRFASNALKVAASVIVFIFLIPYTASLYNGLSRLFSMAFGIDYLWCVLGMAVLTGVYVLVGGYMATAVNDFIQGLIMLVGIVAVILSVLNGNGGFTSAIERLSQIPSETAPSLSGAFTSFFGPQPIYLLGVVLLTSLGTWGLPQMVGKFYAIKNEDSIKKGTVISTLFAIVVAGGCYFLGGFGRLYDVDVAKEGFDAVIPTMLSTLPSIIIGIVIVLVLSASMSTLSSLVLTSGSTITLDFIKPLRKKDMSEKGQMLLIRLFIVFFIIVSAVIAIVQYKSKSFLIAQMMGVSWGALAGAFLAPFLYGLYWKGVTRVSVAVCFVYGVGLEVFQLLVSLGLVDISGSALLGFVFKNSLYSGVFAMVGGLILVPLVSALTPGSRPAGTEEMFCCYDERLTVEITDSLGK